MIGGNKMILKVRRLPLKKLNNKIILKPGDDDCHWKPWFQWFVHHFHSAHSLRWFFQELKKGKGSLFNLSPIFFSPLDCSVPNRFSLSTLFEGAVGREIKENCPFSLTHPGPWGLSLLIFSDIQLVCWLSLNQDFKRVRSSKYMCLLLQSVI